MKLCVYSQERDSPRKRIFGKQARKLNKIKVMMIYMSERWREHSRFKWGTSRRSIFFDLKKNPLRRVSRKSWYNSDFCENIFLRSSVSYNTLSRKVFLYFMRITSNNKSKQTSKKWNEITSRVLLLVVP